MFSKVSPELKNSILQLPEKEKDKLLLRLIRKDRTLIQQLHFQLLEDQIDLEERRERTLKFVNLEIDRMERQLGAHKYYNPRDLLLDLRSMSGIVNQHSLITKDKLGEIELRLHIISLTFHHAGKFFEYANHANEKLLAYCIGRIKNVFASFDKLHEDLQYDYTEKLNEVLGFAYSSALKNDLLELGIPQEV
jgi:hypothetical protein